MLVENNPFKEYPIEFKEINPDDFKLIFKQDGANIVREGFEVENNSKKIIIRPNEDGYINETLQSKLNLEHKNTVVINAAVGQGKSYAIIQTIKRYYDEMQKGGQKYLIVVASPFVSLVKQYCNDIHKDAGIPKHDIYNYDNLGRTLSVPYLGKTVQVVTANTLLGNPGADGFKNSEVKRKYINDLISYCKTTETKVVFVYDEIHDSYHNFKEEYIFNLWKWRDIIHKNFILSATYNEASKVVIEYLAELTDKKIKIIESERIRFPEKQSSLHLHYSPANKFTADTPEISNLIVELVNKGKGIDILSYSKSLAKKIINPKEPIGKLLQSSFGKVKDCTSELVAGQRPENEDPKNQFDNTKCNVGTNFKTGVSIKKDNHALIIILPPRVTRLWFKNKYGVFSGGINSVIQALARQREKGEIHIVLPKPDKFEYMSLRNTQMSDEQKAYFKTYYNALGYYKEPENLVKYIPLNMQDLLLRSFYEDELKESVSEEIDHVKAIDRRGLVSLKFPSYDIFKLESGEDYLANRFPIFGEDISAYITYASLTNQFINCTLKEIYFKETIIFKEGEIQSTLLALFESIVGIDYYNSLGVFSNFKMFYTDIKQRLYKNYQLKYEKLVNNKRKKFNIIEGSILSKKFEIQLLKYTYKLKQSNSNKSFQDEDYSRGSYFLDCIASCKNLNIESIDVSNEGLRNYRNRVRFYQLLNSFREKLINSIQEHDRGSQHYYYVPSSYYNGFLSSEDISLFTELISLMKFDSLLDNKVFEFKRRFEDNRTQQGKLKTFYSMLVEDFLILELRERDPFLTCFNRRRNVKVISATSLIPHPNNIINLVEMQDYINLDSISNTYNSEEE